MNWKVAGFILVIFLSGCHEHKLTGTKEIACYSGEQVVYRSGCAFLSYEDDLKYIYTECDMKTETKITKPATCIEEYK